MDIVQQITQANRILLTTHRSPDGDAIGSVSFLHRVLKNMGKKSVVFLPDAPPAFLIPYLKETDFIVFEENEDECTNQLASFDLAFHLDYNSSSRVGHRMESIFENLGAYQIMIDHHPDPNLKCDLLISKPSSSSTAELLFEVLEYNGLLQYVDQAAATSCYLGIMTDTGSFRFPSVRSTTHTILAFLLNLGIDHHLIHESIYDSNTLNRIKLKSYAIVDKLEILDQKPIGIIALSKEELNRFEYQKGDTEGLVNVILSITGVEMAIFIMEKEEGVKMSFRSKGKYFVNEFAKMYFNGGGHKYAAGGFSNTSLLETIDKTKKHCDDYF